MSGECGIKISFEGLTRAESNCAASDLRDRLCDAVADELTITVEKEDPDSQDAGSTLLLLFGTSSALAIARGIRAYLTMHGSRIVIHTRDGTRVVASGDAVKNLDPVALVKAATSSSSSHPR